MYAMTMLENGVRIITEYIPHVRSAALGIWVGVGSRDEDESVSGIAHCIEHLMFKGTQRRSAKDIAESLDAVGGQLNAFTTKEYTCYHAKVMDEHFHLAADILTDMLYNSQFAANDLAREKNVILEEIKMYEDTPDELVHDVLAATLWNGNSLARPIIGTVSDVNRLDREAILSFYRHHYHAAHRTVVAAAGNIQHDQVVKLLKPVFEGLSSEGSVPERETPKACLGVSYRQKETEQVHICLGVQGLGLGDPRIYQVQVLNAVLGGGISSRLFQRIREERGLVYSVYSYHSSYCDTGVFAVYAGLSANNVNEVLQLICREIEDIRSNGIDFKELQRTKDQIKGSFLLGLESVNARMSRLGKSELYLGRVPTPEDIVRHVEQVTNDEIQALAKTLWRPEKICLTSIGTWQSQTAWDDARALLR